MTLFTMFRSLGLSVSVRPMLDPEDAQIYENEERQAEQEYEDSDEYPDSFPDAGMNMVYRFGNDFKPTAIVEEGGHDMSCAEIDEVCGRCSFCITSCSFTSST